MIKMFSSFRAKREASFISPLLNERDKVLDFGCGDLLIAKSIKEKKDVKIIGVDIIDKKIADLPFRKYNGKEIPFKNKSFDVTYSSFVLHITKNIEELLSECLRVTQTKVIILEDVYNNDFELFLSKFVNVFNILFVPSFRDFHTHVKTEKEWVDLFKKFKIKKIIIKNIRPVPFRPTRHRLFVLHLK